MRKSIMVMSFAELGPETNCSGKECTLSFAGIAGKGEKRNGIVFGGKARGKEATRKTKT
jgi:hypothetical protein